MASTSDLIDLLDEPYDPDDPCLSPPPPKIAKKTGTLPRNSSFQLLTEYNVHFVNEIKWETTFRDKQIWFTCTLAVDGVDYSGEGRNKNIAKKELADKVLPILPPKEQKAKSKKSTNDGTAPSKISKPAKKSSAPIAKTPFVWVSERVKGISDRLLYAETTHDDGWQWFTCTFEKDGKSYTGEGRSKKDAKMAMAEAVLPDLPNIPPELVIKTEVKFPPPLTDKALDRLFQRCQPITLDKFHHKFSVEMVTDKDARSEERLFVCTLFVREQVFTARSTTRNGSKGLCAIEALNVAFFENVSQFKAPPSVEFKGRILIIIAGEICTRTGVTLKSESITEPAPNPQEPHKIHKVICRLSNGSKFTSELATSDKLAKDDVARQILRDELKITDEEIDTLAESVVN